MHDNICLQLYEIIITTVIIIIRAYSLHVLSSKYILLG
jgi:hypothetical protein